MEFVRVKCFIASTIKLHQFLEKLFYFKRRTLAECSIQIKNFNKRKTAMVTIQKGVLIKSDPALQQFIKHLDETLGLGTRFIVRELDETHLFVEKSIIPSLQARIETLLDSLAPDT